MASAENTKKTIESIFEEFYLIVMKDHYMASFINSHQFMERLIQSQSHFLYRALFELNPEEVYSEYYKIGAIHWKIRLDEGYLFKMLDFIEKQLEDKIRTRQIELDFDKLEEVFDKIRNSTGFAYIFGKLDDTIHDLHPISQEGQYLITNIKRFRNHLLKIHNWGSLTYDQDCEAFISDFTMAELGKSLATVAFRIKSYSNRKQQLQIESLNKSIHEKAELSIKYYEMGNYTQTLLMVKHLENDTTLLVTLLEQHEHYWQTNKNDIIIGFLTEKSNEGGLFSITTNASDISGAQLNESLITQIKQEIKDKLNRYKHIFSYDIEDTLYIYSEEHTEYKIDLLDNLTSITNNYIQQNSLSVTETLLNIGYIDTKYLQNLNPEEMTETIRVVENRTKQLTSQKNQVINSINFGENIHQIIEEIKQNLRLKEVVTKAITTQDIDLHFHTIVHVSSAKTFGAESLVRIKHGNEIIPASRFIEIINDYDLSLKLDLAVLGRLIRDIKEVSQKIKTLFVNVNPESIKSDKAIELLKTLISKAKTNNLRIVLELT